MTNIYNGLVQNLELALGKMQRRDTERVLRESDVPLPEKALIRALQAGNPSIREWLEEPAIDSEKRPDLAAAYDISSAIIAPIFARDTRSNFYTRSGGNIMSAMTDLWVQQDPFIGSDKPRSAHIVEYDLINMEAILMATEKMLNAIDEQNKGRKRVKTTPIRVTDGYMRVINGLVKEAFEEELANAGVDNTSGHIHPVRLSNGDEFRLVVLGLDDDQIKHASQLAQEKVKEFVDALGFDALAHLKHVQDSTKWSAITSVQDVASDPALYKAYKYGGAGIKIGAAELGMGKTTPQIEHELDQALHASREERAAARGKTIDEAIEATRDIPALQQAPIKLFNKDHKLAKYGMGTILFSDPNFFKYAMKVIKRDAYNGYYKSPKVDILEFPYPLERERLKAFPYNNPDHYLDEFMGIIGNYVELADDVKKRAQWEIKQVLAEAMPADGKLPEKYIADTIVAALELTLDMPGSLSETPSILKARGQLEEKKSLLKDALQTFSGTLNPYESFDLTRRRILDREAERLHLTDEQKQMLFYAPLTLANARHEDGYCMSGRVKSALQVFQANDQQQRQFSYIGLSSFAGLNEVSTAFARSINDEIRGITADEMKKRFGNKVMDFAFAVQSGRLNVLTHGIVRSDLIDALCEIERRVDTEINQVPIGQLFQRYKIFMQQNNEKILVPKDSDHEDMLRIIEEVHVAQDRYGADTPLAFHYSTEGDVSFRPLDDAEKQKYRSTIAAGKTLFLLENNRGQVMNIPPQVQNYLQSVGYVKEAGQLDLSKPLSILPNPKHVHEHGVRVITAYVELLGRSPHLADQRKDELFRLVEVKKRKLYEPGKGYEMTIPVEAMPNMVPLQTDSTANASSAAMPQPKKPIPGSKLEMLLKPFIPKDHNEWLRELDQREFEMLQARKVPETLLQMITSLDIKVDHMPHHSGYVIHLDQMHKGYDREDIAIPYRRAGFFKQALEEHFGSDISVTGLPSHKTMRNITLHVRPSSTKSKEPIDVSTLPDKQKELVQFFEGLCAIKERQEHPKRHDQGIAKELRQEINNYRCQLRAINLLRHYPTMEIEVPSIHRRHNGRFIITLPQEPGERKSVWRSRNDALFKELKLLLSDKMIEFEEMPSMPWALRSGGQSTRPRVQYQIRIESNPVSHEILNYMASLQQSEQLNKSGRC